MTALQAWVFLTGAIREGPLPTRRGRFFALPRRSAVGHQRSPSPPFHRSELYPGLSPKTDAAHCPLPGAVIHRLTPGGWHLRTPERRDDESSRTGAPAAMRVYRLTALADRPASGNCRRIAQASLSYRLCLRFVHAEHKMINRWLGSRWPRFQTEATRQARRRMPSTTSTATP